MIHVEHVEKQSLYDECNNIQSLCCTFCPIYTYIPHSSVHAALCAALFHQYDLDIALMYDLMQR